MWPFSKQTHFPGVRENSDGTIDFTLSDEEASATDLALKIFQDLTVRPAVADKVRSGTVAVALSHYAKDLVRANCEGITESQYKAKRLAITKALNKAVAAEWKAFSLLPLPIFLYHRASFLQMLGMKHEARQLFVAFLNKNSEYQNDEVDVSLLNYEGTDIVHALTRAKTEI